MRRATLNILALVAASTGCAGVVADGSVIGDADAASTTTALVVIERNEDRGQSASAEASARFVRVASPSTGDEAIRSIGAGLVLPPPGSCYSYSAMSRSLGVPVVPQVELMLAGDVSVEADGVATRLLPRQLPDVTDFVRGIVYARATDAALLPSSKRYVVHVGGAVGLDAFDVSAQAPSDPSGVRIAGETETGIVHVSERPVEMRWTPDAMNDPVYAEIIPSGVRCSLGATGTSSIASAEFVDSGTLTIHRIHRETFHSPGIDSGEIRFDFARAVAYVHD